MTFNFRRFSVLLLVLASVILFGFHCASTKFPLIRPGAESDHDDEKHYLAVDFFTLGNYYYYQNAMELAFHAYRKALDFEDTDPRLRYIIAQRAIETGRHDLALSIMKPVASRASSGEEWRLLGDIYFSKKMFDEANKAYRKAALLLPEEAEIHYSVAFTHEALRQWDAAITAYKKAGELNPLLVNGEEKAVALYMETQNSDSAMAILEKLIQRHPEDLKYRLTLAHIYESIDKDSAAEKVFYEILKKDSSFISAKVSLGNLLLRNDRIKEALPHFKQLHNLVPDNESYTTSLAAVYFELEDYKAAEDLFKELAGCRPEDPGPHYFLGMIYSEYYTKAKNQADSSRMEELLEMALIELNKAVALKKNFMEAWVQLGLVYLKAGGHEAAIRVFKNTLKQFPSDPRVLYLLAVSHQSGKDMEQAISAFEKVLKVSPDHKRTLFDLGALYERTGQFKKAEKTFQHLIKLDPENAMALNYLGYLWADKNINLEKAEKMILKALEIEPENAAYLDSYGWVLFRKGKLLEAEKYILKSIEKMEKPDPVLFDHLGDIYKALNQNEKARENWSKALEIEPENEVIRDKLNDTEEK